MSECRYTAEWADHVLAHLPFYLVLFPLFLDLVTQNASFAAQQAAKHLKRAAKVREHSAFFFEPHCHHRY